MKTETVKTCPQYPQNSVETMPEGNCAYIADASGRVRKLFVDLKALGVVLSIAPDGRLSVDGPEPVMTDALLDRIRADRDGLLATLLGTTNGRVVHCMREPFDVYIGRENRRKKLPGSKWGNPFIVGRDGDRSEVIEKYRQWVVNQVDLMAALPGLVGKVLGCWCSPSACHGDVLVELANGSNGPEPVEMPEGVHCPYCRCRSFCAVPVGSVCARCRRMAWVTLKNGSICRADQM